MGRPRKYLDPKSPNPEIDSELSRLSTVSKKGTFADQMDVLKARITWEKIKLSKADEGAGSFFREDDDESIGSNGTDESATTQ